MGTNDSNVPLAGRKILVVEDEGLVALYNADLLEGWSCSVMGPVGSVAAALALIEAEVPDAALLDVDLGGETSEPVAAALIEKARPFVVTTAYSARHLRETLGKAPLLSKPVDEAKLREVLIGLLGDDGDRRV